jgi:hypothetical protein
MTPEQLSAAVKERQQASLDPLKKEYSETVSNAKELETKIRAIDPSWEPPTPPAVLERISAWVKAQGKAVSKSGIMAGLKTKWIGDTLKKMVEKKAPVLKDDKYSVPASRSGRLSRRTTYEDDQRTVETESAGSPK